MFSAPIAAARALLPWWVPWANLFVAVAAAALIAGISTWLTAAIATRPLRKALKAGALSPDDHARLQWPFVRSVGRNRLVACTLVPLAAALFGDDLAYVPRFGVVVLAALVALFVSGWVARRYGPFEALAKPTRAQRWRAIGFFAIWFARLPVVVAMLLLMESESDVRSWIVAALGVGVFVSFWFGSMTWLMRVTRVVQPASARLLAAVRTAAERCAMRVPAAVEIDLPIANAFAFPTSKTIVATRGLLDLLDDSELASICTHEAAHLTEGPWLVLGRHCGDIALLILAASQLLADRVGLLVAVVIDFAAAVTAALVVKLIASHGERRADAIAHRAEPLPDVYVRALEKLHRVNGIPLALSKRGGMHRGVLRRLFGSGGAHGSFADRAAALGAAAPQVALPPSRARTFTARLAGALAGALGLVAMVALWFAASMWSPDDDEPRTDALRIALSSNAGRELLLLASEWKSAGRRDDALTLLAARAEIEEESPDAMLDFASEAADAGQIAAARVALARADDRLRAARKIAPSYLKPFVAVEVDQDARLQRLERQSQALARRLGGERR